MIPIKLLTRVRLILAFFIVALIASGVTAIPLPWELDLLHRWFGPESTIGQAFPD